MKFCPRISKPIKEKCLEGHYRRSGFALIEVVVAVGIAAFVLTAILGLLSIGMSSSRESMDDTLLSAMSVGLFSDLRGRNFSGLPATESVSPGNSPNGVDVVVFFDSSGFPLNTIDEPIDRETAVMKGAVYRCLLTMQGDQETLGGLDANGLQPVALLNIKMEFVWPIQADRPSSKRIIHAALARYN